MGTRAEKQQNSPAEAALGTRFRRWLRETVWNGGLGEAIRDLKGMPSSVIAASLVINLLGLALPLVMLQIYDRIIANQALETLSLLMIGLGTALVFEVIMKIARAYLLGWHATREGYGKTMDAMERILSAPVSQIEKDPAGSWMDRLDALAQLNAFSSGQSRLILLDLPFLGIYLLVVFLVGGPLVLLLMTVVGLFAAFVILRARAMANILAERTEFEARRDDFLTETLLGGLTVKALAMEPQMQRRLERLQQNGAAITYRHMLFSNELQIVSHMAASLVVITMVTGGAIMVIWGSLSIGSLACVTLLTSRVMQPVMRGIQVFMELENARLARQRAAALFALPKPQTQVTADPFEKSSPLAFGTIVVENVSFAHEGETECLLKDISFTAAHGDIIGIRGCDGGGKTTLLKLIYGEFHPTKGQIRVNGRDTRDVTQYELARWINYVSPETAIFQGTILENITMFRSGPAVEAAREAARLIGLEEELHKLPKGYDTVIGHGIADALPAGFAQRITIARAIATSPGILLFDEANAAFDMKADAQLLRAMPKLRGRMTIIFTSNRPSYLKRADKAYDLVGGRLLPFDPNRMSCAAAQPSADAMAERLAS